MEERGIPGRDLMANAAAAVVRTLHRDFGVALRGKVGILCGGGNNGGDGLVAARLLRAQGADVAVWIFAPPERLQGDAAEAFAAWRDGQPAAPVFVADEDAWAGQRSAVLGCSLLVDALFGTGLLRPLRGFVREAVLDLNRLYKGPIVAVDVPSGLGSDAGGPAEGEEAVVLRAQETVTFAAPKLGLMLSRHAGAVGRLEVEPIGIPEELLDAAGCGARMSTAADLAPFLAPRKPDSHKGNYGHVLMIAGSLGKSGAAVLASLAALRSGAGLVTAAVPRSILPLVAAGAPELMTEPMPESKAGTLTLAGIEPKVFQNVLRVATVIGLGPGLGNTPEVADFVRLLVSAVGVPCVLDADGLNAFGSKRDDLRFRAGGVLTPHPGEMARLFGVSTATVQGRRRYYAERLAGETGTIVVLKGYRTLVADPDSHLFVNPTGNPGMATGGTGDVLTGMIAGWLAQFPTAPRLAAVAAAVYLHGAAGDAAARRQSEIALIASDVIASLPGVLAELRGVGGKAAGNGVPAARAEATNAGGYAGV